MTAQQQQRRRRLRRLTRQTVGVAVVVAGCVTGLVAMSRRVLAASGPTPRTLTEVSSSSSSSSSSDSCGELASWETDGGIVLYIMALGYIFVSLAIICDDYFVSALEKISDALALSPDVAGATFMAAGSSAPELFVSLADNVFKKPAESLGVGTIVGSAIFNILIIISLSGLLAGQVLKLDWRPLLRDSMWYTWAIAVLAFAVWDGTIDVLDSVIMVCSYASYIGYMAFNDRVVNFCCKRPDVELEEEKMKMTTASASNTTSTAEVIVTTGDVQQSLEEEGRSHSRGFLGEQDKMNPMLRSKYRMFQAQQLLQRTNSTGELVDVEAPSSTGKVAVKTISPLRSPQEQSSDVTEVEDEQEKLPNYFDVVLVPPPGMLAKMWFVFTWPIVALARITIPDCRYPAFSAAPGYSATFVISIAWIGVLSHYTVEFGTKFGCITGIPSALMGLTIIAAGTSIPDALSSILVARDGHGDMAVSNALGSNVFDILFGLGLPFLLSNLVYGETVPVSGNDLDISIAILFAVLLFVVAVLVTSRWRLYPLACAFLLMLYAVYVIFSYLRGLDII
ncbi:Sodium/potassium/calcium exchanger 4 [Phytophthora ramorum]|uniref:Sodium/potassium/calcium exchanger 4 n=1 Tax=Phytophthora ramorum TaxID=164328 RepID=UPI0030AA395F|nr:Sodium/potassium/calcium exchanger 4 [Phytophthora ramorum]